MSSFYGNSGYSSGGSGGSGEVISVNGKKGQVTLNAADVHALPDSTLIPSLDGFATEEWVNNQDFLTSEDVSGKANKTEIIPKPATAGTQGQVLTIDANGNPKWDNTSFVKVTDDGQGNVSMETLYGVLVDAVPAQNSNNLVTSGGIYNAINNIANSSDVLFITLTYNESLNQYTANKTFTQINTAVNNGKLPILIEDIGDGDKSWYFLSDLGVDYFSFYNIMGGNYRNYYIQIESDDTIGSYYIQIPNLTNYYTKAEINTQIGNIETLLAQI